MEEVASIRPTGISWGTALRDDGRRITFFAGPVFAEALADGTKIVPAGTTGENEACEMHAQLQRWIDRNGRKK